MNNQGGEIQINWTMLKVTATLATPPLPSADHRGGHGGFLTVLGVPFLRNHYEEVALKEYFDDFLSSLENPPTDLRVDYSETDPLLRMTNQTIPEQWGHPFQVVLETAIKVMKSGIFHNGQFKGKKASGGFKTYPIVDLKRLVWQLAFVLDPAILIGIHTISLEGTVNLFNGFISEFENVAFIVGVYNPKSLKIIIKIFDQLNELLSNTVAQIPPSSGDNPIDLVDYIPAVFNEHVPDAPNMTIAERASALLKKFGKDVKPKTISARIQRNGYMKLPSTIRMN